MKKHVCTVYYHPPVLFVNVCSKNVAYVLQIVFFSEIFVTFYYIIIIISSCSRFLGIVTFDGIMKYERLMKKWILILQAQVNGTLKLEAVRNMLFLLLKITLLKRTVDVFQRQPSMFPWELISKILHGFYPRLTDSEHAFGQNLQEICMHIKV